ncbi:MAG: hypothetical protein ACJAQZ_000840 [Planctomycetota bacterium]|jgi:hypothetical protein
MKTLLATIAFSTLLTCQSPESVDVQVDVQVEISSGVTSEFRWGVGLDTGVGVQAQITFDKRSFQDPKPATKKQDPKPVVKKPDAKKQDPKPVKNEKDPAKDPAKDPKKDPKGDGKEEPRIDRPDENQPVPTGTDPADIAAMKSAEDMLRAEKRLQQEIKAGKITGLDKILPFDELTSWPYEDGLKGMPKRVKKLSGKKVLMTGFMLPIDEVQNIKEFLLVESLWSCCYGQPPDIHGIVRVVMPKKKTTDYFFDPLKLIGTFKVEATMMDGYCVDIYQLHCETLEALKFK